jgi:asparagine synthetase B (glutamine-hydrolysing)
MLPPSSSTSGAGSDVLRLIADVPIAALLSAGTDSALVCWALAKLNADVKAFTVSAPEDPSYETEAARATARTLGIPHETMTVGQSHWDPIDELVDAFGEPFACQSAGLGDRFEECSWLEQQIGSHSGMLFQRPG